MKRSANRESKIIELLDEVHFTEAQRWNARGRAAQGEAFAELFVGALRAIRSIAHAIERTSRLPARTAS